MTERKDFHGQVAEPPVRVLWRTKYYNLEVSTYADNRNTAISFVDADGAHVLRATVNFEPLDNALVYIKDWSENAGVAHALRHLMTPTGVSQRSGFCEAKQYILGEQLLAMVDAHLGADAPSEPPVIDPDPSDAPLEPEPIIDEVTSNVAHEEGGSSPDADSEPVEAGDTPDTELWGNNPA